MVDENIDQLLRYWDDYFNELSEYCEGAKRLRFRRNIVVELSDGRTVSLPLVWYPRLIRGTPSERGNWRLIGEGAGIHWPDLDEDISVENILAGKPSGESQSSFKCWLPSRTQPGYAILLP